MKPLRIASLVVDNRRMVTKLVVVVVMMFGNTSLQRSRQFEEPRPIAASTNSRRRSEITSPRIGRET